MKSAALYLGLLTCPLRLHAQGCAQCNDAVAQEPKRMQAAYRGGIVVLLLGGMGVFGAALVVMRRFR